MLKHILAGLTLAVASCAPPAYAQGPTCLPLERAIEIGAKQYGETPVFQGADSLGSVLLILAAPAGSFTAFRVIGDLACVLTSGEGATVRLPKAPERAS